MSTDATTRTTPDFPQLSWHDNHVHGVRIVEGEDGGGDLILDIDHIVEWLTPVANEPWCWRSAPATLTFHQVRDLRIEIDYAAMSAGIVPFSIGEITQEPLVHSGRVYSFRWRIDLNWPKGTISFQGPAFTQVLRTEPSVRDHQCLDITERD